MTLIDAHFLFALCGIVRRSAEAHGLKPTVAEFAALRFSPFLKAWDYPLARFEKDDRAYILGVARSTSTCLQHAPTQTDGCR